MSSTAVTGPEAGQPAAAGQSAAAGRPAPASPRVGMFPPIGLLEQGPETVRAFLAQVAGAGCAEFNLIPQSPDPDQAVTGAAAVKKLLARA